MNVAFLYTSNLPRMLCERLIESVRKNMPGAHLIHQTDDETPAFERCETVRLPWTDKQDIAEFFWRHLARLSQNSNEAFIKLDYDCIVQKNIQPLLNIKADVVLTSRGEEDPSLDEFFMKRHPHNAGVMVAPRPSTFWREVYQHYCQIPNRDGWMDACDALEAVVAKTDCRIVDVPCAKYNYTPATPFEDVSEKYVVHYKGKRKHWGINTLETTAASGEISKRVKAWLDLRSPGGS